MRTPDTGEIPGFESFEGILREIARAPGYDEHDEDAPFELAPGVEVAGRFVVVREIGRGGFARVYEAHDRVLSRPVALKLLHRLRGERELELFQREASATARLNDVRIVTVHDWGVWNDIPYLVLELLEGEPLADVVARRRLPRAQALRIALEVARAVAEAHRQGVLHLDLKPQNVYLLRDGRVKVLDFGLAGLDGDRTPRIAGGTPARMAPEQTAGAQTDARTDVWGIGVILHELVCGRLPPRGQAPRLVAPLLRSLLAPDPAARPQDMAKVVRSLEQLVRPRARPRLLWAGAGAGALALLAGGMALRKSPPVAPRQRQLTFSGDVYDAELSPRGDAFAFLAAGRRELWVREVDGGEARKIFFGEALHGPRWLPDGESLLITSYTMPRSLWMVPARGGEARLLSAPVGDLNLPLPGGKERAAIGWQDTRITITPLGGGPETRLALPTGLALVTDLDVSADGRFLFARHEQRGELWAVGGPAPPERVLIADAQTTGARWQADGRGVFFVTNTGWEGAIRWAPVPPGEPVTTLLAGVGIGDSLSVARDGRRLLYHRELRFSNLARLGKGGTLAPITRGTARVGRPDVSPDGTELAYLVREERSHFIVFARLVAGAPRARIPCPAACGSPAWSPDGRRLAFRREQPEGWRLILREVGSGAELTVGAARPSWKWGSTLAWLSQSEILYIGATGDVLRVVDLERDVDRPFLPEGAGPSFVSDPTVSPEGDRVAFYGQGGGAKGIYVADRTGGGTRLLVPGGRWPIAWADSDHLHAATFDGSDTAPQDTLEVVDVRTGAATVLWRPDGDRNVRDIVWIRGTDDFVVMLGGTRSDAWLLERGATRSE